MAAMSRAESAVLYNWAMQDDDFRAEVTFRNATRDGISAELEQCYFFVDAERRQREEMENPKPKSTRRRQSRKKPKKNPQLKIHQMLPRKLKPPPSPTSETASPSNQLKEAPKQPKKRHPINFQGFSEGKCKFRPEVGKMCYMPNPKVYPDPVEFHLNGLDEEDLDGSMFCTQCLLEPCLVIGMKNRIDHAPFDAVCEYVHNVQVAPYGQETPEDLENWEEITRNELRTNTIPALMEEIFSKRYAKKVGVPRCAIQKLHLQKKFNYKKLQEMCAVLESSDDDDSLFDMLNKRKAERETEEKKRLKRALPHTVHVDSKETADDSVVDSSKETVDDSSDEENEF